MESLLEVALLTARKISRCCSKVRCGPGATAGLRGLLNVTLETFETTNLDMGRHKERAIGQDFLSGLVTMIWRDGCRVAPRGWDGWLNRICPFADEHDKGRFVSEVQLIEGACSK